VSDIRQKLITFIAAWQLIGAFLALLNVRIRMDIVLIKDTASGGTKLTPTQRQHLRNAIKAHDELIEAIGTMYDRGAKKEATP